MVFTEFLRCFTQHILPRGFVRIRQFGFLTNTRRSTMLALARKLLAVTPKPTEDCATSTANGSTWQCPLWPARGCTGLGSRPDSDYALLDLG